MMLGGFPSPYQEPKNLIEYRENDPLDEVREEELTNIDERIQDAQQWIKKKSWTINAVRVGLLISPLLFLLAAFYKP